MDINALMFEIEDGINDIINRQLKNELYKHELNLIDGKGVILSPCIAVDYKWKIIKMIRQKYDKYNK